MPSSGSPTRTYLRRAPQLASSVIRLDIPARLREVPGMRPAARLGRLQGPAAPHTENCDDARVQRLTRSRPWPPADRRALAHGRAGAKGGRPVGAQRLPAAQHAVRRAARHRRRRVLQLHAAPAPVSRLPLRPELLDASGMARARQHRRRSLIALKHLPAAKQSSMAGASEVSLCARRPPRHSTCILLPTIHDWLPARLGYWLHHPTPYPVRTQLRHSLLTPLAPLHCSMSSSHPPPAPAADVPLAASLSAPTHWVALAPVRPARSAPRAAHPRAAAACSPFRPLSVHSRSTRGSAGARRARPRSAARRWPARRPSPAPTSSQRMWCSPYAAPRCLRGCFRVRVREPYSLWPASLRLVPGRPPPAHACLAGARGVACKPPRAPRAASLMCAAPMAPQTRGSRHAAACSLPAPHCWPAPCAVSHASRST